MFGCKNHFMYNVENDQSYFKILAVFTFFTIFQYSEKGLAATKKKGCTIRYLCLSSGLQFL